MTHRGRRRALNDEYVLVPDRLVDSDSNLLISELCALGRGEGDSEPKESDRARSEAVKMPKSA